MSFLGVSIYGPMSLPGGGYPGVSTQEWVLGMSTQGEYSEVVHTWDMSTRGDYSGVGTWMVSTQGWVPAREGVLSGVLTSQLLKPSGSHQNMYDWQVGGKYPSEMLSCLLRMFGKLFE